MITDLDVDAVRASLPVTQRLAYLNTGTAGPLPRATIEAQAEAAKREAEEGRIGHDGFLRLFDRLTELRAGLAALVGAEPEE
ncbi:MAG TPA: aminotransferase V, partial [Solirubrobacterales bacterium]|nr:aminotransferase V [Solirubrobacterales bacterium]